VPWTQAGLPWAPHSDTSHDAAIAAEAFAGRQQVQYLTWLRSRGQRGGTDAEAEAEIPMRRSAVCARRNEAMRCGLVVKTDQRRGACAVWCAA
jgi:hypothetical protein